MRIHERQVRGAERTLQLKSTNKYLLLYLDDNVHYQQSMMLARSLEEADVLFRWVRLIFIIVFNSYNYCNHYMYKW
jgi:hypothetical protein